MHEVQVGADLPYLRPFLCEGNPERAKIFLVGINPATPIYPHQVEPPDYVELLQEYDRFQELYKRVRLESGKPIRSRTRLGIESFKRWLQEVHEFPLVETDIYTYPTNNLQELDLVDAALLEHSQQLFLQVLKRYPPELVILYGKRTVDRFFELIQRENMVCHYLSDPHQDLRCLEQEPPYATLVMGKHRIQVVVARHLMYYGRIGASFRVFREKLVGLITDDRRRNS